MGASTGTGAGANAGMGLLLAGRYRLGEAIGSGGMGKVWRAQDELLHRTVAVKELTAGRYASEADRAVLHQRTQKEARAAARITHPGVVTVHDVLDHDDRPWIVMQYVDGPSLADVTKESGPVGTREAARVGIEVLAALSAAHAAGVLHRDVKPGNVLLARDGRVLLTDFGIAAIEGDSTITRTGEIVGSIDYLAPERVRGADPGPASDLWSLGVTLYAAVQGTSPFRRTSPLSTMQAVVTEEPIHPELAGPLAPVISALLSKDPQERPSASRVEQLLRAVMRDQSTAGTGADATTRVTPDDERQSAAGYLPKAAPMPMPMPMPAATSTPVTGAGTWPGAESGSGSGASSSGASGSRASSSGWGTGSGPGTAGSGAGAGGGAGSGPVSAASASATASGAAGDSGGRGRWRTTAVAVVIAAVLGGGVGYAALKYAEGTGIGSSGSDTTAGQSAGDGTGEGTDEGTAAGTGDAGGVPEGWERVEAPEGFSLNVPSGWERQMDGNQIDFTPDNGVHLIRISIGKPDFENPYQHMKSMERSVQKFPDYERVKMAPNAFRDKARAALWEFTWTGENGAPGKRHAIDQVYYSDDSSTEYAIYMSSPEEDWDTTRKQFDAVLRSWQPPPVESGP
ncbi:serine/threonine-protein kinase [Streptomyces sp. NPDC088116]|uniref:serine/threonine-protein kinase n=1 Tax=Streptomyces sp. NPDC088116 TaxID=3365825 RepID=UPI003827B9BF